MAGGCISPCQPEEVCDGAEDTWVYTNPALATLPVRKYRVVLTRTEDCQGRALRTISSANYAPGVGQRRIGRYAAPLSVDGGCPGQVEVFPSPIRVHSRIRKRRHVGNVTKIGRKSGILNDRRGIKQSQYQTAKNDLHKRGNSIGIPSCLRKTWQCGAGLFCCAAASELLKSYVSDKGSIDREVNKKELPYASFPRTIRRHSRTSSSQLRAHPHYGGAPVTNFAQAAAAAESCAHLSRSSLPHAMLSGIASQKAGEARGGGGIGTVQTGPASQSLKAQGCAKRLASRLMRERCEKGPYDILELVLCSEVLVRIEELP
ncbi:hypothetical protein C8J57DRAFT_1232492 [Mycena rebaudengoi]|nr:hypothetical protein C8J57DRAFT_1232492 [Mycena rebaudengoi]